MAPREPLEDEFPAPLPDYLFSLIAAIYRLRDHGLDERLRTIGLNVAWQRTLGVLARWSPCTMTELSELSVIDRTTLTRVVDQLVSAGFAARDPSPKDRRNILVVITDAGVAAEARGFEVMGAFNRYGIEGVDPDEIRRMILCAQGLVANLSPSPRITEALLAYRRPRTPKREGDVAAG